MRFPRPTPRALLLWVGGPATIFALSVIGVWMIVPRLPISLWWPAAGAAACFALFTPARQRAFAYAAIFAAISLAGIAAGTAPMTAVAYAAAGTGETVLFVSLLFFRRPDFRLTSLRDATRFAAAATIAASAYGVIVGTVSSIATGGDILLTAIVAAASHASAVLLAAPFALLPPRGEDAVGWREVAIQTVVLAGALSVASAAGARLPLSFLVFAVLIWGVLRFPPIIAHAQSLLLAVTVVILTRAGYALFPQALTPVEVAVTTVTLLGTIGLVTVAVVSSRYDSVLRNRTAVASARAIADAERETAAALRARYELERQREDFIATTSHELRTPVTIIAGYASLLGDGDLDAHSREWVQAISRNTARLGLLLSNLLSLAHPQDDPDPWPRSTSASDLIAGALAPLSDAIGAAEVSIAMTAPADLAVWADREDAKRIIRSLISNAVNFSPAGGEVVVSAERIGDDIMFSVRDQGPGMPPEVAEHVFEPFYRGSNAALHSTPGIGLGLPIARMLARRNHGELSLVTSTGAGVRATLLLRAAGPLAVEGLT